MLFYWILFIVKTPSLLSLSFPLQFIWRQFTSTWSQTKLWKQLPASEGEWKEMPPSAPHSSFSKPTPLQLWLLHPEALSHIEQSWMDFFLGICPTDLQAQNFTYKNISGKTSTTKPGATNIVPFALFQPASTGFIRWCSTAVRRDWQLLPHLIV